MKIEFATVAGRVSSTLLMGSVWDCGTPTAVHLKGLLLALLLEVPVTSGLELLRRPRDRHVADGTCVACNLQLVACDCCDVQNTAFVPEVQIKAEPLPRKSATKGNSARGARRKKPADSSPSPSGVADVAAQHKGAQGPSHDMSEGAMREGGDMGSSRAVKSQGAAEGGREEAGGGEGTKQGTGRGTPGPLRAGHMPGRPQVSRPLASSAPSPPHTPLGHIQQARSRALSSSASLPFLSPRPAPGGNMKYSGARGTLPHRSWPPQGRRAWCSALISFHPPVHSRISKLPFGTLTTASNAVTKARGISFRWLPWCGGRGRVAQVAVHSCPRLLLRMCPWGK